MVSSDLLMTLGGDPGGAMLIRAKISQQLPASRLVPSSLLTFRMLISPSTGRQLMTRMSPALSSK